MVQTLSRPGYTRSDAEAENHPGFTFAIMVDQGAIKVGLLHRMHASAGPDPADAVRREQLFSVLCVHEGAGAAGSDQL